MDGQRDTTYDSKEEEWFAAALVRLEIPFMYQFDILYGRSRRGGYVLDFLLFTVPSSTAVNIEGAYWHPDNQAEAYERARIEQYCRSHGLRYERVKAEEITDVDAAARIIRERLI